MLVSQLQIILQFEDIEEEKNRKVGHAFISLIRVGQLINSARVMFRVPVETVVHV
jgi:hypothetical protein